MEFTDILSVALATLVTLVLAHFAVFWVVRTLYPPPPITQIVYAPAPVVAPVLTTPTLIEEHQDVIIPTYEAAVPVEAPREERRGPPPAESTTIRRDPGVAASNPQ